MVVTGFYRVSLVALMSPLMSAPYRITSPMSDTQSEVSKVSNDSLHHSSLTHSLASFFRFHQESEKKERERERENENKKKCSQRFFFVLQTKRNKKSRHDVSVCIFFFLLFHPGKWVKGGSQWAQTRGSNFSSSCWSFFSLSFFFFFFFSSFFRIYIFFSLSLSLFLSFCASLSLSVMVTVFPVFFFIFISFLFVPQPPLPLPPPFTRPRFVFEHVSAFFASSKGPLKRSKPLSSPQKASMKHNSCPFRRLIPSETQSNPVKPSQTQSNPVKQSKTQ